MPVLELQNVAKRFHSRPIIKDLTLSVERGTIYGFLGPNGAGKTTTIRLVTGILRPTAGRILVDGADLAVDPLRCKRRTGYIPDSPYLYPKLSGLEYLELVADLYSLNGWRPQARALLERFDLMSRAGDFIDSYSYGMRQKLSIVAGVLPHPALVVVDEPLVGLDPPAARSVKDLLVELVRDGAAVFMSTHLLEIAEALCDRVAILDAGELVAEGALGEVVTAKNARLEQVFLSLLAERRAVGSEERARWEALAAAAQREQKAKMKEEG